VKHLGETSTGGLAAKRFVIEDTHPTVDGGRFPVKRIAEEPIEVWADVFRDGHEVIAAVLRWRARSRSRHRVPMRLHGNDRWMASPHRAARHYLYVLEALTDQFATGATLLT
jgi:starch synthase (maltosyl-transferring)